jgi:hypothetical protein
MSSGKQRLGKGLTSSNGHALKYWLRILDPESVTRTFGCLLPQIRGDEDSSGSSDLTGQ